MVVYWIGIGMVMGSNLGNSKWNFIFLLLMLTLDGIGKGNRNLLESAAKGRRKVSERGLAWVNLEAGLRKFKSGHWWPKERAWGFQV